MSIDDTDVLARLRAGADTVEGRGFDADAVLAGSRRALRRRRSLQAVGACTTAAAVAFSLALAGPVPLPGLGDVTLPGSEQVRELFGVADADASGCEVPEPAVLRSADGESVTSLRPGVTFNLTDARPMSGCYDVRIDDVVPDPAPRPDTLTADGGLWRVSRSDGPDVYESADDEYDITYHAFGSGSGSGVGVNDGMNILVTDLVTEGRHAAWYQSSGGSPDEAAEAPVTLRTIGIGKGDTQTIAEIPRWDTSSPTMTDERIAWRHGTTVSVASIDGSGQPEPLSDKATAVGSDNDEIVVATSHRTENGTWITTFTSFRDDGTETTVLTLEHPSDEYVSDVGITDDVLTYAFDLGDLVVMPRVDGVVDPNDDRSVLVRLGGNRVDSLFAAGDAVAWVSGRVAYLLRGTAPNGTGRADLVRVAQSGPKERMLVGLAGDRIAWNTTEGTEITVNVGTILEPSEVDTTTRAVREEPGTSGRAVPAAPVVTVPEDAVIPTLD